MSPRLHALLLASLALATTGTALAATPSVEARLQAEGLVFEVDEDGDYKISFNYPDEGRTQLVFVRGRTEAVGDVEVLEVFAPAAWLESVDGEQARELLWESRSSILGAWESDKQVLYFVVKLPVEASSAQLATAVRVAAQTADDMEIRISGDTDRF